MALDVNPSSSSFTTLPPTIPNSSASPVTPPQIDENSGATAGLSGQAPLVGGAAMRGPSPPIVAAPATPPAPHVSVARHILDALGGSASGPMDWAKSVIAGGLAASANVGKVPEGSGWLAGAARGVQGVEELNRQKMLDQRQAALDQSKLEDEKIQRQMWNANIAGETQRQQEAAELFKYAPAEHTAKLQELADAHLKFVQEQLAVFQSAGIDLSQYVEVTNQADLTPDQKRGLMSHPPTLMAVPNGEPHDAGQDSAGVHLVPSEALMGAKLKKDMTISIPASDEKGNPTTKQKTISAGTPVMDAAAILQGAKNQVDAQQTALLRQADVQQAINKNRAEELKNQPPPKDQLDTFVGKTLPGYTHIQKSEQGGLQQEAKNARTVAELDKVQERALQLETLGTNREISQQNIRANKETAVKSELGKKGLDDVIKTWTDPQHGFTQVQAQAEVTKNSIQAGADGNGLATSLTPTMVVLGVNNFAQTHRIGQAEATAAGAPGGLAERFNAWITKASSGKLSPQLAKEGNDIMDNLIVSAHRKAIINTRVIAGNSGLDPSTVTVTDRHGNPDTLAHQILVSTPPNGTVGTMKAIDGKLYYVGGNRNVLGPAE
jgi:hypothetical protein